MKVFLTGTSLLPSYGGPAFSVSRLAVALTEAGAEVGLWTADQSVATTPLLPRVSTVRRVVGTAAEAVDSFGRPDIVHDNGIWSPHNHDLARLAARLRVPRVISTRGMLEPWALRHKRFKKTLAWYLYQVSDLKQACCHHATSEAEARSVERLALKVPVVVVPNGVDVPQKSQAVNSRGTARFRNGQKTALFLGRIYTVKGLSMLVRAWARVRPAGWVLRIVGPDEAGHQEQIERAVSAAGLEAVVSFAGPVDNSTKEAVFFDADLFVLPSYSESFGVVVAEALAHGVPVLTTKATPWSVLAQRNCGWWVEATVDGIAEGLRDATGAGPETLEAMGLRGLRLVTEKFGWNGVAEEMLSMYSRITAQSAHGCGTASTVSMGA